MTTRADDPGLTKDGYKRLARKVGRIDQALAVALDRCEDEHERFPFNSLVPKDFRANCEYRQAMVSAGFESPESAAALRAMCARDCLFYVNTFIWTYDPRLRAGLCDLPLVTYPVQDDLIREVVDSFGVHDLIVDKSRDMGGTFCILAAIEWLYHFTPQVRIGVVSRNEDYVDRRKNPKTIFWKLDFFHRLQPRWLLPSARWRGDNDPNRTLGQLVNPDLGGTISGEATTGDMFSGDRCTTVFIDELAKFRLKDGYDALRATADVTANRIFCSSRNGPSTAFYKLIKRAREQGTRVFTMDWTDHPVKRIGLYRRDGRARLHIDDRRYWSKVLRKRGVESADDELEQQCQQHQVYDFNLDDGDMPVRSPWFDAECLRRDRREVLIEILRRDDAAASPFFDIADLNWHRANHCRPPNAVGELDYNTQRLVPDRFVQRPNGHLNLWFEPVGAGTPPTDDDYVIGADVATGTKRAGSGMSGASNSVLSVLSLADRRLVAQYTVSGLRTEPFAELAVVMARWFSGRRGPAKVIWEAQGPGAAFGEHLMECGHTRVYMDQAALSVTKRVTRLPGYSQHGNNKTLLMHAFRDAIGPAGGLIVPSDETIGECEAYQYGPNRAIVHSAAIAALDFSSKGVNHGDRVIATALAWWLAREQVPRSAQLEEEEIPEGSWKWLQMKRVQAEHDYAERIGLGFRDDPLSLN